MTQAQGCLNENKKRGGDIKNTEDLGILNREVSYSEPLFSAECTIGMVWGEGGDCRR